MQTPSDLLPDLPTLTRRLKSALDGNGSSVRILERKRPRYMSTFPNEIVTCQTGGGTVRRLFCKYEAGQNHNSHGHRGGLVYEAKIYRRVLSPLKTLRPQFIGASTDTAMGDTWLVLECLDRCTRLKDIRVRRKGVSQSIAMVLASGWLGQFHAAQEPRVTSAALSFLKRYDADYYEGWMRRAVEFSRPLHKRFSWLPELCRRGKEIFEPLLSAPPTVIHGEFYINNILVRGKKVFPVDWESAAIAAGEIDVAAQIEGPWREALKRRCEREYLNHRYPAGVPADFQQRLDTARLYLQFRWLGERPDWTLRAKSRWRVHELKSIAKRLGLIPKEQTDKPSKGNGQDSIGAGGRLRRSGR